MSDADDMDTEEILVGLLIRFCVTITKFGPEQPGSTIRMEVVGERDDTRLTGRGVAMTEERALQLALRDAWEQMDALARLSLRIRM